MQELFKRLTLGIYYLLFWLAYFILARLCFMIYFMRETKQLSSSVVFEIFWQGLKLDLSMTSYLAMIPFIILAITGHLSGRWILRLLLVYTIPLILVLHFLMMFDLGLYGAWNIRLDATPFIYIDTPKEMFASIPFGILAIGVAIWLTISFLLILTFRKLIEVATDRFGKMQLGYAPVMLFFTALLVIFMRGGLQTIPINQSSVYVFDEMFANHAAINFAWNFAHSIKSKSYDTSNPFVKKDTAFALRKIDDIRKFLVTDSSETMLPILKVVRPNIILIIWESLTAKIVEPLGGEEGVTERLNALVQDGILFENFYANGDRSDKGLVAVFSGYYPQPDRSIMKMPSKSRSLPMLGKRLAEMDYQTSFYYGGDLNFGNMNTYFRQGGISHLIDEDDFLASDRNSKWGVHDHVVLDKLKQDLSSQPEEPFFKSVFTLSSHEPFEFPGDYKFGNDTEVNSFRSAHAYTDRTVGDFVDWAKTQAWWDQTLLIIMADHGHSLPRRSDLFNSPDKYHIPMLWLGGALASRGMRIGTICSQKDLAYTLLGLLQGDQRDFTWSHDIFTQSPHQFAQYIFNRGFGLVTSKGFVIYDYNSDKTIGGSLQNNADILDLGLSITQAAYQDFIDRE